MLWSPGGFRDDAWRYGEMPDDGVILPLGVLLTHAASLKSPFRLGVRVKPGEAIETLAPHLAAIGLIALEFPAFSDGRSYSKAERLRGRFGWTGTLRAVGEVLIDQIPHMLRVGFDEFEVSNETALARLAEGRIAALPVEYQPAAASAPEPAGYAWRRQATRA